MLSTTKHSVNTHIAEHQRHCHSGQPKKSAVVENVFSSEGHTVLFVETQVLLLICWNFARFQGEVIEILKHGVLRMNRY